MVVNTKMGLANGFGERYSVIDMLAELPGEHRKMVAADKDYDRQDFVASCQGMNITPYVSRNTKRHYGYAISMKKRKRVEEPFGWGKAVGLIG